MRTIRLLPIAILLLAAPAAQADAPWSAPTDAGPASVFAIHPDIAFSTSGRALISWWFSEADNSRAPLERRLVTRRSDGALSAPTERPLVTAPALYGRGGGVALMRRGSGRRVNLYATYGSTAGGFKNRTRLATRAVLTQDTPAVAAARSGEAAALWIESRGGRHHLRLALKRNAGAFGKPRTIAEGRFSSPTLAYTAGGMLVIAYQRTLLEASRRYRQVVAIVKERGKAVPRVAQLLGPSTGFSDIGVAAGAGERIVVAWGTQDVGEEASRPWVVRAAVGQGGVALKTQLLDPGAEKLRAAGSVRAAIDPDGRAMVAWDNVVRAGEDFNYPVRVASADDTGTFAPFKQVAPNGAVGDLEFAANGTAMLVWSFTNAPRAFGDDAVMAALRVPETDGFGAPERIALASHDAVPSAEFDPRTGRPVVVWASQDDSNGPYRVLLSARG